MLFELAASVPSGQDIVEVGSYLGRSTAFIGLAAGPGCTVHAVDPLTSEQFLGNMEKVGVADKLERHTATSVVAARSYKGRPVGLLFVDAIHTERAVLEDGQLSSTHLAAGCLVAFDDVNRPTVMKAVQRLVADGVMPEFVGHVGKVAVSGARRSSVGSGRLHRSKGLSRGSTSDGKGTLRRYVFGTVKAAVLVAVSSSARGQPGLHHAKYGGIIGRKPRVALTWPESVRDDPRLPLVRQRTGSYGRGRE